ncbi:predicted protein [Thalassiosira pseudonana CCMP1335]|uniref:CRAL-TRIO domain-containing protein n=1 Tax=Thalassiosira pseudonana TaxID=35128 RepID=B8BS65_THAPS|nr:predicted protein [Thalassiosira pseudonana CCMP1335]EED96075.1 predicted protein [Thalassiosira pseudonana CCMP1335]|eukprot:scaffold7100_cov200-Alexandrium_tamarense.AAC.4
MKTNGFLLLLATSLHSTDAFMGIGSKSNRAAKATQLKAASGYKIGTKVEGLQINNRYTVESLQKALPDGVDMSEIALLRFAIAFPDEKDAETALLNAIKWRQTTGKHIVDSARDAVTKATASGGWDNEVVRDAAPHADIINQFITPKAVITTSTEDGDLVYVIRASQIDDKEMMDVCSVEQVCDFFMYAKEVHNIVANQRSEATGRMCSVIFANDISGVRKAPDKRFSQALTSSSDQYEDLYPSLAGPTMILNLPLILQAFVGLLKPLFPKSVQERLVFKRAKILASLKELTPLATDATVKTNFVREVTSLLP